MRNYRSFCAGLLLIILVSTTLVTGQALAAWMGDRNREVTGILWPQGRKAGKGANPQARADVSGDWSLTGTKREDPDPHELTMVLKQEQDTFSGSLTTNKGRFDVKDGKVRGSQITFSIYVPQASVTAACSGTVDGESLKATCQMPDSTIDLEGHRQKKAER
jgi:hypothetical protein